MTNMINMSNEKEDLQRDLAYQLLYVGEYISTCFT